MVGSQSPRRSSKVWALVDQACQSATNFLTMVLAARYLPVEAFAQFSLAFLAVLFAASFHRTWVTQPMNILGGQAPDQLPARAAALWRAHGLLIPSGVMLVVLMSPFGFADPWLLFATALYLSALFLQEMQRRYAYTRFCIRQASVVSLCMGVVQVGGLALLVGFQQGHPGLWMGVLATAQLSGVLLGLVLLRFTPPSGVQIKARVVLAEQFSHSRWVIASQIVFWGSSQMYPFLLAGIVASQVATFNAGMSILNAANVLRMTLANYLPAQTGRILAQQGEEALCRYTRRALFQLTIAGLVGWPLLLFVAEPLVHLLYGSKFPGAVGVLRWVAIGIWASMFSVVLNAAALALGTTRNIFISNALGAAFSCTAGVYFTYKYGLQGAIWSNVVGYVIPAALQMINLWPRLRPVS